MKSNIEQTLLARFTVSDRNDRRPGFPGPIRSMKTRSVEAELVHRTKQIESEQTQGRSGFVASQTALENQTPVACKNFRRVLVRFDYHDANSLGFVHFSLSLFC